MKFELWEQNAPTYKECKANAIHKRMKTRGLTSGGFAIFANLRSPGELRFRQKTRDMLSGETCGAGLHGTQDAFVVFVRRITVLYLRDRDKVSSAENPA